MGLDGRIGPKFLHAGAGYGGSCLPKDTQALAHLARSMGEEYQLEVVEAAIRANAKQQSRMIAKIERAAGPLEGKTVAVLGLSFKPNTDDLRESVAVPVIQALRKKGAVIRAYDPAAMEAARPLLPDVVFCNDAYDAAQGADALVLVTEWNPFRNLDLERVRKALRRPLLIDLRNVYDPEKVRALGFEYVGVGRGKARKTA
jgi:UDPglucose 6-dehydrogenase